MGCKEGFNEVTKQVFERTKQVIERMRSLMPMKLHDDQKDGEEVHKERNNNSRNDREKDSEGKAKRIKTSTEREEVNASKKKVVSMNKKQPVGGADTALTLQDIRIIFKNINRAPSDDARHKKKETGERITKEKNISLWELLSKDGY
jgi:hypothetical protein